MGNHASQVSRISTWRQLSNGLKKSGGEHQFFYYIRVDLSGKSSDLPTLRYLLLLIQSCPSIDKKLAVFLRDAGSPPLDPSKQNELYFKLSHLSLCWRLTRKLIPRWAGLGSCAVIFSLVGASLIYIKHWFPLARNEMPTPMRFFRSVRVFYFGQSMETGTRRMKRNGVFCR